MSSVAARDYLQDVHFRRQVDKALETVTTILDNTRNPLYAEDEDHTYQDKYGLAEFLTNTALAAQTNVLERMGLSSDKLEKLLHFCHVDKKSISLRLSAQESCSLLKEVKVQVQSPNQLKTTMESTTSKSDGRSKVNTLNVNKMVSTIVQEFHWTVSVQYEIFAYAGSDPNNEDTRVILQKRDASTTVVTTGNKDCPIPEHRVRPGMTVPLTWFLQNINPETKLCSFRIDRSQSSCHTPRRNNEVDEALEFFRGMSIWTDDCSRYFFDTVDAQILGKHKPGQPTPRTRAHLSSIQYDDIFVPILPLFEKRSKLHDAPVKPPHSLVSMAKPHFEDEEEEEEESPLMSLGDINLFLAEQCRALDEKIADLANSYPPENVEDKLVSVAEATTVLICGHSVYLSLYFVEGMDYIENMLRHQLFVAIGKEVKPSDFEEFMRFHYSKIFKPQYAPTPFCYAIRRPDHYPEGVLTIEMTNPGNDKDDQPTTLPIITQVRTIPADYSSPLNVPINAATTVQFTGNRYLHAWVSHRFESATTTSTRDESFSLVARARQFSSFMLIVGNMTGPNSLNPKDAIILQNKDEIIIPLLLNELPTAKEFKDAISSLSPEQQRFAKAFRGMQLESSVMGVCIVQLKPQLEKLLGLPPDALTKKIKLTQELLSLFIEYQIPSDLLTFDGEVDAPASVRVEAVEKHVQAVQEMLEYAKAKQLAQEVEKADMRAEVNYEPPSPKPPPELLMLASPASAGRSSAAVRSSRPVAMKMASGGSPAPDVLLDSHEMEASYEAEEAELVDEKAGAVISPDAPQVLDKSEQGVLPSGSALDFTMIPKQLDAKFDEYDKDHALRATIIKPGSDWTLSRQQNLLVAPQTSIMTSDEQKSEKAKAFDLLDALSRSGSLPIASAELHVVIGVTHCFEQSVMTTVIEGNVNPIEKMEVSSFLIASTIHGVNINEVLKDETQQKRLMDHCPAIFDAEHELT